MTKTKSVKEKIEELRVQHEKTFEALGLVNPLFVPRICYTPVGEKEQVVSFFEADIVPGKDIYTHFVNKSYESEDPQNRLWKWTYNPYFETEYKKSEPHPETGHIRYIVPLDEFELVDKNFVMKTSGKVGLPFKIEETEFPDPTSDLPLDQMTIRDLAAIMLKKPVSRKTWLNDIINSNNDKAPWE